VRRVGGWVVAAAAFALAVRLARPFRVEVTGRSMEPALREGDWLVATRAGARRRGSVVVVADPRTGLDLVKRIAAVPGEQVDGRRLGPDEYLVLGDNPELSTDGRTFGAVSSSAIEGVVRARYLPNPRLLR
jgi:signal peptidase I